MLLTRTTLLRYQSEDTLTVGTPMIKTRPRAKANSFRPSRFAYLPMFLLVAVVLYETACFGGAAVDFTVSNQTGTDLIIEFDRAQNCLEPAVLQGFIGSQITIPAGGTWMKTINRRNGYGCDGKDAIFWGSPIIDGRRYGKTGFLVTGDGKVATTDRTTDYPSLFARTLPNNRNTYTWTVLHPTPRPEQPDNVKLHMLSTYAPRIYLDANESYYPSSVEWAFPQMIRVNRNGNWWLYAKERLSSPSDNSLELFKGDRNLRNVPVYAFWVPDKAGGFTDLVYFMFYPYNRGKKLLDSVWGNHVGDWENLIVRLDRNYAPQSIFLSQHDEGQKIAWNIVGKTGTHPVVFAARGSHGLWTAPGDHLYRNTSVGALYDSTSAGAAWDTWNNIVAFDFRWKRGLGASNWPRWMDKDYAVNPNSPRNGNSDPASGAIFRWGNGENGCGGVFKIYKEVSGNNCRLNDGPTGPIDKADLWSRDAVFYENPNSPLAR